MTRETPKTEGLAEGAEYVVRHDEQPEAAARWREQGVLRARRLVDTEEVRALVGRDVEDVSVERVATEPEDSGEIEELADGSISIPLFEEELVVTKRIVLRERVVIRKETRTEEATVSQVLRRERVAVEADEEVEIADDANAGHEV